MRVSSFLLCDAARVGRDGTFEIRNGGLTEIAHDALPARRSVACALALEFEPGEAGPYEVEVALRDPHGKRLQTWRHSFSPEPGQKGAHLALNLREAAFPAAGAYLFDVRVNGRALGATQTVSVRPKS